MIDGRLLGIFFFVLLSHFAHAQIGGSSLAAQGITINGDNVSRDYDTKSVVVEGNVEIGFGDQKLTCDKASVNLQKSEVIAQGNVLLVSPTTTIQGTKITYNYKTKLGVIEDGYVQSGQVVFEGKKVQKKGENEYEAKNAQFTSCTTCPAAWSFSGAEIDAEIGGYAFIKYPVLRMADFPVFILPRLIIPLQTERQSGLLVPELKFSNKGGAAFTQSVFWAINDSQDLTYAATHYSKRGLKHNIEYRYMLSENSSGLLRTAYLRDRAFTQDDSGDKDAIQSLSHRKFIHYEHYYDLPDDMVQRMNINLISDLRYVRDFDKEIAGNGDSALENSISLTQNREKQHRSIEATYYQNLLQEDATANNDNAVHRFPEINYNIIQQQVGKSGAYWQFDLNYVNFARRGQSFDDVTGAYNDETRRVGPNDGIFNPSQDVIRSGQRLIMSPTVSYPFHIGQYFDVNPSVAYNEAQYHFPADSDGPCPTGRECGKSAERRYLQTDVSVKTKANYVFGPTDGVSNRYKHEIVPEVIYSTIPWAERPNHVFFGDFQDQPFFRREEEVANSDFFNDSSKIQFDYKDRLYDKRLATFVLTNNLIRKKHSGDYATYHQLATFRIKQSYDFNEVGRQEARPWSPINGLLDIRGERFETHTVGDFYPYAKVTNWSTRLRFMTILNNFIELTYAREVFVDQDSNIVDHDSKTENYGTGLGWKLKYIDVVGKAKFSAITQNLDGWEYTLLMKPPGDCWTIKFSQRRLTGTDDVDTELGLNFLFGGGV